MATRTSDAREVKDPAEETAIDYAVEITIPTTAESLKCGVRLASEGDGYYLSDWWVEKEWDEKDGVGSFAHEGELECGYADNGDEFPFSTRRSAALNAAGRLLDKLREIDPDDDLNAQDDVTRFRVAAEIGDVPELEEPFDDSLPSGDNPLSDEDGLAQTKGALMTPIDWPTDDHTWWWMRWRFAPQSKWQMAIVERVSVAGEAWVRISPGDNCLNYPTCHGWEARFVPATPPPKEWM